jgi:hypothetical protein
VDRFTAPQSIRQKTDIPVSFWFAGLESCRPSQQLARFQLVPRPTSAGTSTENGTAVAARIALDQFMNVVAA